MAIQENFNQIKDDLMDMSQQLFDNPELGDEEYESSKLLVDYLRSHDFTVEAGLVDRPTSFKAEFTGEKDGPTIAFLAEYDALPRIGHGCGHNLIATIAVGAGVILSKQLKDIGGKIVVLGTPAEETNGAKVPMSKQGVFDDIDVAMMVHPAGDSEKSGASLAMDAIQFDFHGKTSHAAASPEKGINALDGVIQFFNGINALREHVPEDIRMHGIITNGGEAANIVPDHATAQFYFRAKKREVLDQVVEKVKRVADGVASITGTTVELSNYELGYDNMVTNEALSDAFTKNLQDVSVYPILPAAGATGSTDMGDVSQVVPAIHPYIGLNNSDLIHHTIEFADQTVTKDGCEALESAILALAQTGYDLIDDDVLFETVQKEFNEDK